MSPYAEFHLFVFTNISLFVGQFATKLLKKKDFVYILHVVHKCTLQEHVCMGTNWFGHHKQAKWGQVVGGTLLYSP